MLQSLFGSGVRTRFLIGAMGGVLAAACARTDPLDAAIDAASMNQFLGWKERHVAPLGESLAQEFAAAVEAIKMDTPDFRAPSTPADLRSSRNALCLRLDGRRLRDVLVEGYGLINETLRQKIYLDQRSLNVVRLRMSEADARLATQVVWYENEIRKREDLLRRNEARRRELQGGAS